MIAIYHPPLKAITKDVAPADKQLPQVVLSFTFCLKEIQQRQAGEARGSIKEKHTFSFTTALFLHLGSEPAKPNLHLFY